MSACPVCDGELRRFLGPLEAPVFCNVLHASAAEARDAPRGTIELAICGRCAMVVNTAFDPGLAAYGGDYENALHFSAVFREYAERIAARLVERHRVRAGRVVEVGCGDGYFLELLCSLGGNAGLGYDPSVPAQSRRTDGGGELRIVPEYYGPLSASGEADLVCARHVLEHIAEPRPFVDTLRAASGGAVLYLEVPDAEFMLREHAFWDVIYEHCNYFCATSLRSLLGGRGYRVIATEHGFGGQYLEAEAAPDGEVAAPDRAEVGELQRLAAGFEAARRAELRAWEERIAAIEGRIVLWGAGSKGVSLAAELPGAAAAIAAAVDINPRKQGRYLPGSGIVVVGPEDLRENPPDRVLAMNANYVEEIRAQLAKLGLEPEVTA